MSLRALRDAADIPDHVKDFVTRMALGDPAAHKYLLEIMLTMFQTSAKEPFPIPFSFLDPATSITDGEGAIMCGLDTGNQCLHIAFMPGTKEEVIKENAKMNQNRVQNGMAPCEIIDPNDASKV